MLFPYMEFLHEKYSFDPHIGGLYKLVHKYFIKSSG